MTENSNLILASQEPNQAVLTGGLHYRQGKAWIQISGQWIRVPMYDKESKTVTLEVGFPATASETPETCD
jgi:hypothetical protein